MADATRRRQSAVYEHRGTRAVQRMVEYAPSTGGLALWIRHIDAEADGETRLVAANDGVSVYYGPDFEDLSLAVQTGVVAHQVLHVALRHSQRQAELERLTGDVDPELFNICADAIINSTLSHLNWLELPTGSVLLEDLLAGALMRAEQTEKGLLEWDVERLYRAVDDRRAGNSGSGGRRGGRGQRQDDGGASRGRDSAEAGRSEAKEDGPRAARARHLAGSALRDLLPAADTEHPEGEAEQAREWRERITRAHAGDGVHSMLRTLLADIPTVRTPWEQLLRTQLTRGLSMQPELSWSRPSRSYIANRGRVGGSNRGRHPGGIAGQGGGMRMPWEPGRTSSRAVARLAVLVDVSGSVENPLMHRFAAEVEAISRRLEAGVLVIIGDDKVREVRLFEPGRSNLRDIECQGGGGTDFTPLLAEAERHGPDMAVFLTDLDGRVDYCPRFPVLWAVPADAAHMQAPFGRKLVLE